MFSHGNRSLTVAARQLTLNQHNRNRAATVRERLPPLNREIPETRKHPLSVNFPETPRKAIY